mgnify:CR=1 FL=1
MRMSTKTQLNFVNGTSRHPCCLARTSMAGKPVGRVRIADERHRDRAAFVAVHAGRRLRSGQGEAASIGAERVGVLSHPRKGRRQITRQGAVDPRLMTRRV